MPPEASSAPDSGSNFTETSRSVMGPGGATITLNYGHAGCGHRSALRESRGPRHHSQPGALTRAPLPTNVESEMQVGIRRGHARLGYLTCWRNDSKVPP